MTDKQALQSLLERVKQASGPNYQLECEINDAIDHDWSAMVPPNYTASVDAALALVKRVLPGLVCDTLGQGVVGRIAEMKGLGWIAEFSNGLNGYQGQATTLPLAIIAALLRALLERRE